MLSYVLKAYPEVANIIDEAAFSHLYVTETEIDNEALLIQEKNIEIAL
ncbi:hypothetical protein [Subsaximicrobium wynnwilliamsii]|nr:hypothetical protein [Subsaximicrobium wynnwilliamsii]